MYGNDGMPQLVDAPNAGWGSPPPALGHASAGATPYWHGHGVGGGSNSAPVIPGGFGAGTPHPHQQRMQPYGPNATPAHRSQSWSPAMGRNVINPLLAPTGSVTGGGMPLGWGQQDPFSIPAAAFDQRYPYAPPGALGYSPPPPHHAMNGWGAAGASPPALGFPSPFHASTPRTHQQYPEDGEDDSPPGLGGWTGHDAWNAWGSGSSSGAGGAGPSPNASVINGFASGPRSQYKRPNNWRQDFSMSRPGALSRVLSLGGGMFSKPVIHKLLDAKKALCSWDIRRPPEAFLVLPDQRPLEYLELQEGAMTPTPPFRLQIVHPMLPWTVKIEAGPGAVVTIGHLVSTLHLELARPVYQGDFWNDEVSEQDRKKIHDAWVMRCAGDRAIAEQGIKRVDFLCDRWVFEGLRRVGDSWEMKLKSGRGSI